MDTHIRLKDVKLYAYHGVDPQENTVGTTFMVNLCVKADFTQAMLTDELQDTVSYADLFEIVKQEMKQPSKLLEHVSGRIVRQLFSQFPSIQSVELELTKENPPIGADCAGAGVSITTDRASFLATTAGWIGMRTQLDNPSRPVG